MARGRQEWESPPPQGIIGQELIASIQALFEEAARKGYLRDRSGYTMMKMQIVAYLTGCSDGRKVKAKALSMISYPDGKVPGVTLKLPPASFTLTKGEKKILKSAKKWETIVETVQDSLNPHMKRARNKQKQEERLEKKREREAALELLAHRRRDLQDQPFQLARTMEVDPANYGYAAIDSHQVDQGAVSQDTYSETHQSQYQGADGKGRHQAGDASTSMFQPELQTRRRKSKKRKRERDHTWEELERDAATDSAASGPDDETQSVGEQDPLDPDGDHGDEALLQVLESLSSDIAFLPPEYWAKCRGKLIHLGRDQDAKTLPYDKLLSRVTRIVYLPLELDALEQKQWEQLEAAIRICARVGEVLWGSNENTDRWMENKMRDLAWWKDFKRPGGIYVLPMVGGRTGTQ